MDCAKARLCFVYSIPQGLVSVCSVQAPPTLALKHLLRMLAPAASCSSLFAPGKVLHAADKRCVPL